MKIHNEHEISSVRKLAADLGMSFYAKISWDSDEFSPSQEQELVRNLNLLHEKDTRKRGGYLRKLFATSCGMSRRSI